jgi:hypothetical protein
MLKALAVALAAVALFAPTAQASWIDAAPEIFGPGTIAAGPGWKTVPTCSTPLPAMNISHKSCDAWSLGEPDRIPLVILYATPQPGSTFDSWTGCDVVDGNACVINGPKALNVRRSVAPQAKFVDRVGPKVTNFRVTPLEQGLYRLDWDVSESPVIYRCALEGVTVAPCGPGMTIRVPEDVQLFSMSTSDYSENQGTVLDASLTTVDTVLTSGPQDGAILRAQPSFTASSGLGEAYECSVDGGPRVSCGDKGGALTLPALGDGKHTLSVRAIFQRWKDLFPAERSWTQDTTAPATTLSRDGDAFVFGADEDGVTFRCRIDGGEYTPCASPLTPGPQPAGVHWIDVVATDRAGNTDLSSAVLAWSVDAPRPREAAPAPPPVASPVPPPPFAVRYAFSKGRFTALSANRPVTVTLRRPHRRAKTTTLAALLGKKLPNGTKVVIRAGGERRTLTVRGGRVR